ncbi:MAG: glycerol-3-phosphate dehydrogenase/oxidase [Planctomycetota bacterium]|jgi:glycerol-3-phosphate dehydrogenase
MGGVDLRRRRDERAEALAGETLDVLIIGGGIVGAGIGRDAAMRGLRVGLVEQHDLAFGTSSRSSRLLHGGLRYLAQGRIGLVYEASREKRVLHRIAPHLAQPLAFVFPTYRGSEWPLWKLRIGVKLYDLLCGGRNLGPSRSMGRREVVEHVPGLDPEGLTGAVRYYDGLTNDARLVLDSLRSADRHGAIVGNYLRVDDASPEGAGWRCEVHDVVTDRRWRIAARVIVHATGPWAERLLHSRIRLRLTKGVHLVVDRRRLPTPDAVVITRGRRILFAIPWGDRVILGTTDTDFAGPIEAVQTGPADVAYILDVVNGAFPSAKLSETDVVSHWAGLRPLVAQGRGGPSDISRAHRIHMPKPGWIDVAGGKLTTYRLIARQVVNRLLRYLGRTAAACRTAVEPLLQEEPIRGHSGILPPEIHAEVVEHYVRNEWAVHLDDVMLRRAGWHYYHADAGAIARQAAAWMARVLDWSPAQLEAELARYGENLRPIGVRLAT